ncbi:peptidase [Staphylococcus pseudintermedius]|uniref:peptidase n=1 Tax=Staphylococcus pseudintermedius TaxID=283734 RepID=UPI0018E1312D|nr:peptidase [Staphylococcus pseudintermedius]EGQ1296681.1 peptidase [Staphylococcus pseudintermedius]EGQ2793301.1 peptidase [Staphylococcus pseudintermedius]EGQ2933539.1 peptidase [Staphylococcus pseudintermedius]EGQ3131463.1 peptidase [Staphylococcus pseudintermedius]EGQ3134398.1 peptidase [Staphylococcus pseudintermedius]
MLKKLIVTGLIATAATQVYAHDTQAAEKGATDAPNVMVKDEAKKEVTPIIHKPTCIYPHLEGEDDAAYLKRMATNPPEGAVPYGVLNKDGSITEPNTNPHFDVLKIEDPNAMKDLVDTPADDQDTVPSDLQIEPPALIGPAAKHTDVTGDAKSNDDHNVTKSSGVSAQDMKKKDVTTQTAQPKADKKMATAKVAPAKQQDKAAKMLPAAGEPQVNAISQTALALSMIALGVIAFFTRRRKTN